MAIEGSLDSVDIQDVVQLLNINRSTGKLHLHNAGLRGIVYYLDGEIINAEVEGMKGEAAAYVLLSQYEGHFQFQMTGVTVPREINRSIHDLVLEAARRKDTIGKIRTSIRHDNIVYLPLVDVRIPHLAKDFNEAELSVLRVLDGQADIQSVIDKHPLSAFEVLYIIYDLEQRNVLKRVDIYKVMEVKEYKKLFGKPNEILLPSAIFDDWQAESMTYSQVNVVEVHTSKRMIGQIPIVVKAHDPVSEILVPKPIMDALQITVGEKVLIKPLLFPDA
ncbi:MAG: DUF4388 domain-containing protein [Acidobacteria bacterium]|nr:DUF4388 domain-containing protein [Acidobacteriota bacterium]